MYFDSFSDFLAMGGHGFYVWLAYGVFLVILVWNIAMLRINRANMLKRARKAWRREEAANKHADQNGGQQDSVTEAS